MDDVSIEDRVINKYLKRLAFLMVLCLGLAGLLAGRAAAQAQTQPGVIQGAPLTIQNFEDGSLQVWHERYQKAQTFGTSGSGFMLSFDQTTFGPYNAYMEFVDQSPTQGTGSAANPFQIVQRHRITHENVVLNVMQTVRYINGSQSLTLEWQVANAGTASICLKAYHAADLYFADSDLGFGYYDSRTGSIGGYNQPKDWYMVFTPLKPASHYEEAGYRTIWNRVTTGDDLKNTIVNDYIDNGAALQWDFCLESGQTQEVADVWSFGDSAGAINLAAQQAAGGQAGVGLYRPVETGSPALTTTIPTPLDVSFTPPVMGANLLWAALATILFIIATELFNRNLAEYEEFLQRLFKPIRALNTLSKKAGLAERLGRPVWYERIKLALIILIYGLIFSLLDPTWQPLSVNGVWLFITMGIAFGLVGLSDDIIQWNTARRWLLPTRISIRPGNLLMAGISTLFSRSLGLLPGIMFGMPEAFEIDPESLDRGRKNRLLELAAGILLAILVVSWAPTILTNLLLNAARTLPANVQPFVVVPLAALQSLLLLIFAVTVQNLFLHMLALPDTIGEMIKGWNRFAWFLALLAASFIFLQFLLNPTGDLAHSLESVNVRTFLATIAAFLLFTFLGQFLLRRLNPPHLAGQPAAQLPSEQLQAAPPVISPVEPPPAQPSNGAPPPADQDSAG
jgi:hypothetical protein